MFSLSWQRDGVKGISVKGWSCSPVFQTPTPSAHILLQGVTRHKTFGRAMAVRNGFGTAASQREAAPAVASAGIN